MNVYINQKFENETKHSLLQVICIKGKVQDRANQHGTGHIAPQKGKRSVMAKGTF